MENLCWFKNHICNSHKCCHFCDKKNCTEKCRDDYDLCIYKTNEIPKIGGKSFVEKTNPQPRELPERLKEYKNKILSYKIQMVGNKAVHQIEVKKGRSRVQIEGTIWALRKELENL